MKLKHLFYAIATLPLLFSCEPEVAVTGIAIDPSSVTLTEIGQEQTLTVTLAPEGAKGDVVWESSNTAVVTVEGSGLTAVVTAVGKGTAKITASVGIFSGECNVVVKDEEGGNGELDEGNGSKDAPYNVTQVLGLFEGSGDLPKGVWAIGYIVGGVKTGDKGTIESNDDIVFGTEGIRATAVLIADSKDVTDFTQCVIVNLPTGAIRSAINLADNAGNLHKKVSVFGNVARYFAVPGVRDLTDFVLDKEVNPNVLLDASFATGQDGFSIVNVLLPTELERVWYHNAQYTQMAAGSFANSRNYKSEAWLISPAINLSNVTNATLSFQHAGKQFGAPVTNLTIQVSTTYTTGAINATDWTEIAIPNHLEGESNTFKSAGDIDLTPYCGQSNVRVAFKYTSTDESGGNWYVKNVTVK